MRFDILFEDEAYVAINKPHGILVHRTRISEDTVFVLQLLRNQLGRRIYPIHRLDRATSGVLLFGKTPEAAGLLGEQFMDKSVEKKYLAIVRGYVEDEALIDYPLTDEEESAGPQPAQTRYRKLGQSVIDAPIGLRYTTARFSLVEIEPETGRRQQIRKHFSHIRHPIIGDKRHGDVKHNTYFREVFGLQRLLLHAASLSFVHPHTQTPLCIAAPIDSLFEKALDITCLRACLPPGFIQK